MISTQTAPVSAHSPLEQLRERLLALPRGSSAQFHLIDASLPERLAQVQVLLTELGLSWLEIHGAPLAASDVPAVLARLAAAPTSLVLLVEPDRATFAARRALEAALAADSARVSIVLARPATSALIPSQR